MPFKASYYNIVLEIAQKDRHIVYNTLNDSIAAADDATVEILKPDRLYNGNKEDVQPLVNNGMLVDASVNELDLIQYRYYALKYDMNSLILNVMPTYACNLACPYCFQGTDKQKETMDDRAEASLFNFTAFLIERFHPKQLTTVLYGGEPLLEPERCKNILKHIFELTRSHSIDFLGKLITNGTLLTQKRIEELQPYLSGVQVTFDGSRDMHDRMRAAKNSRPTYDILLRNVCLLVEKQIPTIVRVNVSKENVSSIVNILDDFIEKGLRWSKYFRPYWGRIVDSSRYCSSYSPRCFQDAEWSKLSPKLWRELYRRGFVSIVENVMSENHPASCRAMSPNTYTVAPNGDLYNCLAFAGDPIHKIGYLEPSGPLKLNSRFYEMMARNPFEFEECKNCVYLPRCGGGCTAIAYTRHGSYKRPDCPDGKQKMEYALKFYLETKFPELVGAGSNVRFIWAAGGS